jgi:hypothetical protein
MPYTRVTMRQALARLSEGDQNFVWEESKGAVNPQLAAQPAYQRAARVYEGQNVANLFLEYCWLAYSKAREAAGPQLIGRKGDLWVPKHLDAANLGLDGTLWDPNTKGNIQKLDKWAPTVNDCWVLGGIHRHADFELVSVRTLQNLWDFKGVDGKPLHVVTAREIIGVLHSGYSFATRSDTSRLVSVDTAKADAATIEAYDQLMRQASGQGPDSIRSVLQLDPKLQKQIQEFDRSKLRHVEPPTRRAV